MGVHRQRRLLLSAAFAVAAVYSAPPQKPIGIGGWFDFPKPVPYSRVLALAASRHSMAVSLLSSQGAAEVLIFDADFKEVSRWRVAKRPDFLTLTTAGILAGYRMGTTPPSFRVCPYQIDGSTGGPCVTGDGWPVEIVSDGDRVFGLEERGIIQIDVLNQRATPLGAGMISGEGPSYGAAAGSKLVRLNSVTLNASVFDTATNTESQLRIASPQLSRNDQKRGLGELLISTIIGRANGEMWLAHGRHHVLTGLPIDRFDGSGGYMGTVRLAIPQFPAGQMVPALLAILGNRLVMVDPIAARCARFDLKAVENGLGDGTL